MFVVIQLVATFFLKLLSPGDSLSEYFLMKVQSEYLFLLAIIHTLSKRLQGVAFEPCIWYNMLSTKNRLEDV